MAEESKFSGVFAKLKEPPQAMPSEEGGQVNEQEPGEVMKAPVRGRGRPRSNSSDPDYQPTTVILRKTTKRRAAHLLEDLEMGKDLSELI